MEVGRQVLLGRIDRVSFGPQIVGADGDDAVAFYSLGRLHGQVITDFSPKRGSQDAVDKGRPSRSQCSVCTVVALVEGQS